MSDQNSNAAKEIKDLAKSYVQENFPHVPAIVNDLMEAAFMTGYSSGMDRAMSVMKNALSTENFEISGEDLMHVLDKNQKSTK